jgi:hypothetical protein
MNKENFFTDLSLPSLVIQLTGLHRMSTHFYIITVTLKPMDFLRSTANRQVASAVTHICFVTANLTTSNFDQNTHHFKSVAVLRLGN